jgi:hypothetical protein
METSNVYYHCLQGLFSLLNVVLRIRIWDPKPALFYFPDTEAFFLDPGSDYIKFYIVSSIFTKLLNIRKFTILIFKNQQILVSNANLESFWSSLKNLHSLFYSNIWDPDLRSEVKRYPIPGSGIKSSRGYATLVK